MNEQQPTQPPPKGWKRLFDWSNVFSNSSQQQQQQRQEEEVEIHQKDNIINRQQSLKSVPSFINSSSSSISLLSSTDTLEQIVKSSSDLSIHNNNNEKKQKNLLPTAAAANLFATNRNPLSGKEHNINRHSSSSSSSSAVSSSIVKKINHRDGGYIQKKHLTREKTVQVLSVNNKKKEKSIDNIKQSKPNWGRHPNAWGYLHSKHIAPVYLEHRLTNERKGYLIGSDSSCDIQISEDFIQPRHCLIYAENYTNMNNQSSIRVNLRDLSDDSFPTITSVDRIVVEKNSKEPVQLHTDAIIKIKCPISKSKAYFQIELSRNSIAKKFSDEYVLAGCSLGRTAFSQVDVVTLKDSLDSNKIHHVVKRIQKQQFRNQPKTLQYFKQEIGIHMSLEQHPGIVGIEKVYDEADTFNIVMEYLPEGDLYTAIISSTSFTEEYTRNIFKQLFNTVKFLHNLGIVHRDIKLENILMANKAEGRVKICDFGLATLRQTFHHLTTQCGTGDYIAPEILCLNDGDNKINFPNPPTRLQGEWKNFYGKECDLWSLGVVLYCCLCGKPPFYDRDGLNKKQCILNGIYDFTDPAWSSVSDEAKELIKGLMTVDPQMRVTLEEAMNHPWMRQ